MANLILDTGVLIAIERGVLTLDELRDPTSTVAVAAITVAEFTVGTLRAAIEQQADLRRRFLATVLREARVLTYDQTTAAVHAQLLAAATAQGLPWGAHDLIIAAHAAQTGRILVTTDDRADFGSLPGLSVRTVHR